MLLFIAAENVSVTQKQRRSRSMFTRKSARPTDASTNCYVPNFQNQKLPLARKKCRHNDRFWIVSVANNKWLIIHASLCRSRKEKCIWLLPVLYSVLLMDLWILITAFENSWFDVSNFLLVFCGSNCYRNNGAACTDLSQVQNLFS